MRALPTIRTNGGTSAGAIRCGGKWSGSERLIMALRRCLVDNVNFIADHLLRRLDRSLAIDRDPLGLFLERLGAKFGVKRPYLRRSLGIGPLREKHERALKQHAHPVVLACLRLERELF